MCRDCGCEIGIKKAQGELPVLRINPNSLTTVHVEQDILAKNDALAKKNRDWFKLNNVFVLNMISSPGSGKTLLLEKTVQKLGEKLNFAVLNGDQEKDFDAQRLQAAGAKVKQLNTISSCHLDADMIHKELGQFVNPALDMLVIENVGNLVCPAAFDLGENEKVALLSCTEGEDKPSKYPLLFREANIILLTKMDLVPHLDWSLNLCIEHIRKVNPRAQIIEVSAKTGSGMDSWADYLISKIGSSKNSKGAGE